MASVWSTADVIGLHNPDDKSCIDWDTDCDGNLTKCNVYDTEQLAYSYIGSKYLVYNNPQVLRARDLFELNILV